MTWSLLGRVQVPLGLKRFQLVLQLGELALRRAAQHQAPADAVAHGAQHIEVRRGAVARIAGAARFGGVGLLDRRLDQVGQFEVVEQQIEELAARQGEDEIVGAFAVLGAFLAGAVTAALGRFRYPVSGHEFLVARKHPFAVAAGVAMAEPRFADAARRDRNLAAVAGVDDAALVDRLVDGPLDLLAGAPQKPLAVAETFIPRIEPPIYEMEHMVRPRFLSLPC